LDVEVFMNAEQFWTIKVDQQVDQLCNMYPHHIRLYDNPETWQDYLHMIGKWCMPDAAHAAMQEKYPGDYTLQQRYDSEKGGYYYTMHWENEASKTFWLLKYS